LAGNFNNEGKRMGYNIDNLIESFKEASIKQFQFTKEGNYRKGNEQIKKINNIHKIIKEMGESAQQSLLLLVDSEIPEVSNMAAVYCMRFNHNKCLNALQKIIKYNIPLLSSSAKQSIENWKNKKWYID
jgi:hypothetical protein